ncbi:F0F1 ATP synthase subunit delta [Oceanobacillus halotolerans]|uniref:F0F1 ATP synthase subunit delta n=1 Tax=Oceanobacillus halotolerans TaxID=2663380 RepID=UPI0013D905EE|nr:F0F1 ATP synthase subunit delta [Oceanobacillus halotolerans]
MSERVVAKRYADALFQLGNEKSNLDQLVEEFRVVRDIFQSNQELVPFLKHPRIAVATKKAFLEEALFEQISVDVIRTLKLLVDRHRIEHVPAIVDHFIDRVNEAKGIAEVTVYSVRELTDEHKQELESTFAKRFNKETIQLENVVDPSLIGGLKIRMGNTILDGSISGKLRRIERNIVTVNN